METNWNRVLSGLLALTYSVAALIAFGVATLEIPPVESLRLSAIEYWLCVAVLEIRPVESLRLSAIEYWLCVATLEIPPVGTPIAAVKAAIITDRKGYK
jgi:hypothetical protein